MTPDEILQELRDIHLPQVETTSEPLILDPAPFVILGLLTVAVAAVRYYRGTRWRREAHARLDEVKGLEDTDEASSALVRLLRAIPARTRLSSLPGELFERRSASEATVADLDQRVRDKLRERKT